LVGGTRFYERKEVKDILAYLRVIDNEKDNVSFRRIEKLGKTRLKKFMDWVVDLEKEKFNQALVAGGGTLNASFMAENLIDEIYIDVEPKFLAKEYDFSKKEVLRAI